MGHPTETTGQAVATTVADQQAQACPACGQAIVQEFCPACGERKFERSHFSFKHFSHEALHELAHFDSKIFRTVRSLFTKPGLIAQEYLAGKRSRYWNPLRAYLFCFALVLFVYSVYRPVYDVGAVTRINKTGLVHRVLAKQSQQYNVSEEKLIEQFNELWHFYMEFARVLDAFIVAGILAALYFRRKWYLAEHAVVALYYLSFVALLEVALWPVYIAAGGLGSHDKRDVLILISLPYMWFMLRRVYKNSAGKTTLKTLLLYLATYIGTGLTTAVSVVLTAIHIWATYQIAHRLLP